MNKVLVLAFICLLIIASIGYCYLVKSQEGKEEKEYQGAVPKGYDLEHFRKTGQTVKEVSNG